MMFALLVSSNKVEFYLPGKDRGDYTERTGGTSHAKSSGGTRNSCSGGEGEHNMLLLLVHNGTHTHPRTNPH